VAAAAVAVLPGVVVDSEGTSFRPLLSDEMMLFDKAF